MTDFELLQPQSVQEACEMLQAHAGQAKPLAGGTDLVVELRARKVTPKYVINLNPLSQLAGVTLTSEGGLRVGALARLRDIELKAEVRDRFRSLWDGARLIGSVQIRNLGTLAGNICHATPSADTAPPALVHEGVAVLQSPKGSRQVPLTDFFTGPGATVLRPGELMTELVFPPPAPRTGSSYLRLTPRQAMDLAFVGVASLVTLENGNIGDCKIALGAVAPTSIRVPEAEALLEGKELTEELLQEAGRIAAATSKPITDLRASKEYRRDMVEVLTRRTLKAAYERASSG